MILDIEGKEINIGDDVIIHSWDGVRKARIKKFTEAAIHFNVYNKDGSLTSYREYCHRTGQRAKMYKL